jgi:hypothetical protein
VNGHSHLGIEIVFEMNTLLATIDSFFSLEYWENVGQNAIGCTLGSFLAISFSYVIYRVSVRKEEGVKQREVQMERNNTLKYFSELIKNIIQTTHAQVHCIDEFKDTVVGSVDKFPLMTMFPLYDFRRVSENLPLDKVLLSFTASGKNSVLEFREIIGNADFLTAQLSLISELLRSGKATHEKLFEEMYILVKECKVQVDGHLMRLKTDNESANKLYEFLQFGKQNAVIVNSVSSYYTRFILPLNRLMIEIIQYDRSMEFQSLYDLTVEGIGLFERIVEQNRIIAQEFEGISGKIKSVLTVLEENAKEYLGT